MIEWNPQSIGRMFELYEVHIDRLKRDVAASNKALGSPHPDKTNLNYLTRTEFEVLLKEPAKDPEAIHLWVRRIIRGHEHEFPELQAAG
jgi:hypothetical protein